jgi:hypothetical protein
VIQIFQDIVVGISLERDCFLVKIRERQQIPTDKLGPASEILQMYSAPEIMDNVQCIT